MQRERQEAHDAVTTYRRKQIIKDARQRYLSEAEATSVHLPLFETFIHFQLMTGARRSETLTLTWSNVNLDSQTAYLPETKNGRARKLPLRRDLVEMLRQLPRNGDLVFPVSVDGLRKAWARICSNAGLTGAAELRVHDLRHEAISRVAEAGSNTLGGFSLVDLQHFSGHRDVRMLLRYAHLCTQHLAKRLDAAFGDDEQTTTHHGMRRLRKGANVTLTELVATNATEPDETDQEKREAPHGPSSVSVALASTSRSNSCGNVVHIDFKRRTA